MQTFPPIRKNKKCGDDSLTAGRLPLQLAWYDWARGSCRGATVLDVGCGTGEGVRIMLANGAASVTGQDVDKNLPGIITTSLDKIPDASYDVVTCFDVIEHVKEDLTFFNNLYRIARKTVFISTPNRNISHANNEYHCREYTFDEFVKYFQPTEVWTNVGGYITKDFNQASAPCFCGVWKK